MVALMANAGGWIGTGTVIDAAARAADAWRRINEKPATIILIRSTGTTKAAVAAQTVRVEYDNQKSVPESSGAAGVSSVQRITLFGIRGHDTEDDTDIRRDDQFSYDSLKFRVVSVIKQTGEVQAKCEAMG
jgi:hypothetical protein